MESELLQALLSTPQQFRLYDWLFLMESAGVNLQQCVQITMDFNAWNVATDILKVEKKKEQLIVHISPFSIGGLGWNLGDYYIEKIARMPAKKRKAAIDLLNIFTSRMVQLFYKQNQQVNLNMDALHKQYSVLINALVDNFSQITGSQNKSLACLVFHGNFNLHNIDRYIRRLVQPKQLKIANKEGVWMKAQQMRLKEARLNQITHVLGNKIKLGFSGLSVDIVVTEFDQYQALLPGGALAAKIVPAIKTRLMKEMNMELVLTLDSVDCDVLTLGGKGKLGFSVLLGKRSMLQNVAVY